MRWATGRRPQEDWLAGCILGQVFGEEEEGKNAGGGMWKETGAAGPAVCKGKRE